MTARRLPSPGHPGSAPERGFTLVEMIVAITIIGILGAVVALFIRAPVQGYADSVERAGLTDAADLALRRMTRDLRLALPNSIRVNPDGSAIEFMITKTGGRYLSAEDGAGNAPVLDFTDPSRRDFSVVGAMPDGRQAIEAGDLLVVYNLGPGFAPADAYRLAAPDRNIARIAGVAGNTITLADNPFAAQDPPMHSPAQRFHVVTGPVTYSCGPDAAGVATLSRQSDYAVAIDQPVPAVAAGAGCGPDGAPGPRRCLLASRVASCRFGYNDIANRRSALVTIALELQPQGGGEATVRLVHQVHVSNTP